jgi:hypothetical protein
VRKLLVLVGLVLGLACVQPAAGATPQLYKPHISRDGHHVVVFAESGSNRWSDLRVGGWWFSAGAGAWYGQSRHTFAWQDCTPTAALHKWSATLLTWRAQPPVGPPASVQWSWALLPCKAEPSGQGGAKP